MIERWKGATWDETDNATSPLAGAACLNAEVWLSETLAEPNF